jgi:glycosyltransferase involved in cell wall biosynthesis
LVVSFSVVPGSDRQGVAIETVIKALAPRFQVDVLTIRSVEMGYVERYRRTRMLRVPVGAGNRMEQVEAFRRAVRRQLEGAEYDLIHFRSAYGGVPVCQLREYLDCKLVYELALSSSTEAGLTDSQTLEALRTDERFCLAHADLIIVPSAQAATALQARGASCPVAIVTPGVDLDTFDWEPAVPQPIRRIAFAGRIGPSRGLRTLVHAFAEVQRRMDSHLILVGPIEQDFRIELGALAEKLELTGRLHLLGELDHEEIPRILAMADVCVCPFAPDLSMPLAPVPLKLLEYLACRRPTVAVDQPVVREVLGGVDAVRLVTPGDPQGMAAAILQLLSEPHQAEMLAKAGYNLVRQQFTASASRRALLTAYSRVVPVGANLWGHGAVVQPITGSAAPGRVGTDRFHDTQHDDRRFGATVTPTGKAMPVKSGSKPEPWVLIKPDTSSDFRSPVHHGETSTDPEFVAAGALLTGSGGPSDQNENSRRDVDPGCPPDTPRPKETPPALENDDPKP